jgi:miniconductance mechanosensitive channel
MELIVELNDFISWFKQSPFNTDFFLLIGLVIGAYFIFIITRRYVLKGISKAVQKSRFEWDDAILNQVMLRRIAYIPSLMFLLNFTYLLNDYKDVAERILHALLALVFLLIIGAFINSISEIYDRTKLARGRPIKGFIQVTKLVIYVFGSVIIIAVLIGQSPWYLLSGLGAITAVLLLVFRDTILSFVASLQISSNDLVRVGDWIEVPAFSADGDVLDIALHTIQVQNWDKTITVIPTHKLIEVSFKNWRGMQQAGGRRIKRSVYIDQNSIRFLNSNDLERLNEIRLLKPYIERKKADIETHNMKMGVDTSQRINGRRMTNIGTFRAYLDAYLHNHNKVHKEMTIMVRQMAPGENGLPLEIYVFTNTTEWLVYEGIQSDIFDHIFAVIAEFDLRIFQNPTGQDFGAISRHSLTTGE